VISVIVSAGVIEVKTPYCDEFVSFARMRKAIWKKEKRAWLFDPRDEFAVRSTLIDIYGTDDYATCEKVDVRLKLDGLSHLSDRLIFFGRELARREFRDYGVKLGDGVVVVKGGFPPSGGSRRSPELNEEPGTVLEVRDVPRTIAERMWAQYRHDITIIGGLDREKLEREREQLQRRIEEINQLLEALAAEEEKDPDVIPDLEDCADAAPESSDCQVAH
jgi:hypothetical protein